MRILKEYFIKFILYLVLTIPVFYLYSCEKDNDSEKPGNSGNGGWDSPTGMGHEETGDYTWDESTVVNILLNENEISASSGNVSVNGATATIIKGGNYAVSGSLSNGSIIVNAGDNDLVRVILRNASIHNESGPAILIMESGKTIIALDGSSQNALSDGVSYANPEDDPNAALFSKSDMTIFGSGYLSVDGNYKDGITGKDGLIVKSGKITVSSEDDGIRGKDYLIIDSPDVEISAGGDGLRSDNEDSNLTGQVLIYGGNINAITGGDGIAAGNVVLATGGNIRLLAGGGNTSDTSSVSQKGIKAGQSIRLQPDSLWIDATDHAVDSDSTIEVKGGKYVLFSARAGIHSNQSTIVNGGDINIIRSMEGFESKSIIINNGTIRVSSIDDCLNATAGYDVDVDDGSYIGIIGGYVVLDCMRGDGIDSNGSIDLKGGKVIVHGPPAAPEVAVDFNNSFNIRGGFLAASGTDSELLEYPDSTSAQNSIMAVFAQQYPGLTIFNISDEDGNTLLTFQPTDKYQSVLFTSPDLKTGETYYLDIDGYSTGTNIDGLIEDGTYTSGSRMSTITISSPVTVLSNLKTLPKH